MFALSYVIKLWGGREITFIIFFYNCVQFVQNLKTDQLKKIILRRNTLCQVLLVRQSAEGKHFFKSGLIQQICYLRHIR